MARLRPISAPFNRRWREFRFEYLPLLAFAASVLAALVMWDDFAVPRRATTNPAEEASVLFIDQTHGSIATFSPSAISLVSTNSTDPEFDLTD